MMCWHLAKMERPAFLSITNEVINRAFLHSECTRRQVMKNILTLLLFFAALGISGCSSLHDIEDWGYMGDSERYEEGGHRENSEYDD